MGLYEKVSEACKAKGLSICALEKEAAVGNGVVGKWRESKPNIETLMKIAKVLDMPVSKLLEE